jgi:hypothetical protein
MVGHQQAMDMSLLRASSVVMVKAAAPAAAVEGAAWLPLPSSESSMVADAVSCGSCFS